MGFLSRVAEMFRKKDLPTDSADASWAYGDWGMASSGVAVNSYSAMQHSVVLACTSILAEDVAKLPLDVYRRLPNGGKKPATDHWLYQLLRHPNPWQTRFEFVEIMQGSLVLRGNAYASIVRNGRGIPEALVPVHPDHVAIWEAPDGQYFYLVTRQGLHEQAALKSLPLMIPAEDMLHIRWLSSWNSLIGISRVQMMREAIGLSMAQEQMAARIAGSGARPGGVIETDGKLTKEVIDRLKADWQQSHGSVRNAGKTAILEQGLHWKPMTLSMVDAEFLEQRRFSLFDIARGFRVPLYKLGVPDVSPGSGLVQLEQDYWNSVISSYTDRWKLKLEATFDLDGDELFVDFDYARLIKADMATRLNALRIGIVGGIYTVNEAREAEGLPRVDNGDVPLQPTNMAPLGFVPAASGSGPGSDTTGAPAQGGDGDGTRLPGDEPAPST